VRRFHDAWTTFTVTFVPGLTLDGRVDLVLDFEDLAVAIEVKVWSLEHETPSGRRQTDAYVAALEELLKSRGRPKRAVCVLLTPDGRAPGNPQRGRLTFVRAGAIILDHGVVDRAAVDVVVARLLGLHFIEVGASSHRGSLARLLRLPLPLEPDRPWLLTHIRDLLSVGDLSIPFAEAP
jgi:hypothetical protein